MSGSWRVTNARTLTAGLLSLAMLIGCCVALSALALAYMRYLASDSYIDHVEATMIIVGYNYLHGQPIYDLPDGIMRLSAMYGPLAYLTHAVAMHLFGQSVLSARLAVWGAVPNLQFFWLLDAVTQSRRIPLI